MLQHPCYGTTAKPFWMIQATLEKKKKKVTLVTNMAEEHEAMKLSDGPIFLQPYTLKPLKYIIHATQKKKRVY